MKNIRILEDGNRLIVVLEGYDKSAIGALMEVLGTDSSPLEHIRPHTGETQFHLKGTEKEVQVTTQAPIKPPAFVEKVQAEEAAVKQNQKSAATRPAARQNAAQAAATAVKAAPAARKPTPAPAKNTTDAQKPADQAQTSPKPATTKATPAAKTAMPAVQAPQAKTAAAKAADAPAATAIISEKAAPAPMAVPPASTATEPVPTPVPNTPLKPIEMMNPFELKDIIRQADRKKLAVVAKKIGAYNTVTSILNSDTRTLREFVKRLRTA